MKIRVSDTRIASFGPSGQASVGEGVNLNMNKIKINKNYFKK